MPVLFSSPVAIGPGTVFGQIHFEPADSQASSVSIAVGILTYSIFALKISELRSSHGLSHQATLSAALVGFSAFAGIVHTLCLGVQALNTDLKTRIAAFFCSWLAQFVLAQVWVMHRFYVVHECLDKEENLSSETEVLRSILAIMGTMAVGTLATFANVSGYVSFSSLSKITFLLYLIAEIVHWCLYLLTRWNYARPELRSLYQPSQPILDIKNMTTLTKLLFAFSTLILAFRMFGAGTANGHLIVVINRAIAYAVLAMGHTIVFTGSSVSSYRNRKMAVRAILGATKLGVSIVVPEWSGHC